MKPRFKLGQKVYILDRTSIKVPCPICNGTGIVQLKNGLNIECPINHFSENKILLDAFRVIEQKVIVVSMEHKYDDHINKDYKETHNENLYYILTTKIGGGGKNYYYIKDEWIFTSLKEAHKTCKMLNDAASNIFIKKHVKED